MKRRFFLSGVVGGIAALALRTPARAQSVQYTYDALGRLTSVTRSNGQVVTYSYDAAGNRTWVASGDGTTTTTPPPPPPPPPVPLSATVSDTVWEDGPAVVVVATGGTGPYIYGWQRVSGNVNIYAVSPGSNAGTWYYSGSIGGSPIKTGVWRCLVTDAASGSTYTETVTVTINVLA